MVSPGFGDALPLRSIPVGNMRAIAFGQGDTLFGGTTSGRLYRINIATGDTQTVGVTSGVVYSSFSFHPVTGQLWAGVRPPSGARDRIYRVDPSTGAATLLGTTGDGAITQAVTFDHAGRLYGLKGTGVATSSIITIDTATGAGTTLGSAGVSGLLSLVIRSDSAGTVDVPPAEEAPASFALEQNYPNPFNPATTILFRIASAGRVRMAVTDLLGQEVALLADADMPAGQHSVRWDAGPAAAGVYFATLMVRPHAGGQPFTATRKLLLLR
jgi:hypothetical protein